MSEQKKEVIAFHGMENMDEWRAKARPDDTRHSPNGCPGLMSASVCKGLCQATATKSIELSFA